MANYFSKFSNKGIPFMDDRRKCDMHDLLGEELHVSDFGFINGQAGDYAVVAFKEHPEEFYFGGKVLTDILHQVDADGMRDELTKQGLVLTTTRSKRTHQEYIGVDFLP